MKILQTAAVLSVACATLVTADKGFRPPAAPPAGSSNASANANNANTNSSSSALDKFKKVKTVANFGKTGAKMEVCPSGDCTNGQSISLALSRLEEYSASGQLTVKGENFNTADSSDWSDLVQSDVNGVAVLSTSYVAKLNIKDKGAVIGTAALNLTASIFAANGTTMNGNQSVPVPLGGLKFTLAIADWPFRAATDSLRFALSLKAKAKMNGTSSKALGPPEKKKLNGTAASAVAKIDRVDFGEGMFLDAPSVAVLDGVSTDITASVETGAGDIVEYVWVFPSFKKTLFYDPVVGSTDVSAQIAADTTATAPTSAPTAATATPTTVTPTTSTTTPAATTSTATTTTSTTPTATVTTTTPTPTTSPATTATSTGTTTTTTATATTTTPTATTTKTTTMTAPTAATTTPTATSQTTVAATATPTTTTTTTATTPTTAPIATTTTPTPTTKTPATVTPSPTSSASHLGSVVAIAFAGVATVAAFAWI